MGNTKPLLKDSVGALKGLQGATERHILPTVLSNYLTVANILDRQTFKYKRNSPAAR